MSVFGTTFGYQDLFNETTGNFDNSIIDFTTINTLTLPNIPNSLLKTVSGVVSAAVAGTDYQGAITPGTGIGIVGDVISNTGVLSVTGTASQIIASAGTGAVTLSLPQSIAVTSSPTFTGLTLSGLSTGFVYSTSGSLGTSTLSTDSIPEGKTNLYFTNARARSALSANNPITYDTVTGAIGLRYTANLRENGTYLDLGPKIGVETSAIIGATSNASNWGLSIQNNAVNIGTGATGYGLVVNSNFNITASNGISAAAILNPLHTYQAVGASSNPICSLYATPQAVNRSSGTISDVYNIYCPGNWGTVQATNAYNGFFKSPASTGGTNISSLYADDLNVGVAISGTPTLGDFRCVAVKAGLWNGSTIGPTYGGTGFSSYAVGDLLYANTTTSLAKRAAVATGQILISQGVNTAPVWSATPTVTNITIGSLSGVLKASTGSVSGSATTTDLTEGTNLYFTNARAIAAVGLVGASTPINVAAGYIGLNYTTEFKMTGSSLDLPQSIKTTATPQFAGININTGPGSGIISNLQGAVTSAYAVDAVGEWFMPTLSTTYTGSAMWGKQIKPIFNGMTGYTGATYGMYIQPSYTGAATGSNYSLFVGTPTAGNSRCAIYGDSINCGIAANATYTSGLIQAVTLKTTGNLFNGDFSTSTQFYKSETISTTWTLDGAGHTTTGNVRWTRSGGVVTVAISNFTMTYNGGAPFPLCTIPAAYVPTRATAMSCVFSDNGVNSKAGILYVNGNPNLYIRGITGSAAFTGTGFGVAPIDPVVCITGTYSIE